MINYFFFFWLNQTFITSNKQAIHSLDVPNYTRKKGVFITKKSIKGEGTYLANEYATSLASILI